MKKLRRNTQNKKEGITLVSVVLLSTLLITAVLGTAQIIVRELSLSTDTLNGERAYFAAESGIEQANLLLLKNPIHHGPDSADLIKAKVNTTINNIVNPTEENPLKIDIQANGQQTIRLQTAPDGDNKPINTFPNIKISTASGNINNPNINWVIRCKDLNNSTNSIQGIAQNDYNLVDWKGQIDTPSDSNNYDNYSSDSLNQNNSPVSTFWSINGLRKETCTLSFENLSTKAITVELSDVKIAPEIGTVTAIGKSTTGNQTKTIQFETYQSKVNKWINWGAVSQ